MINEYHYIFKQLVNSNVITKKEEATILEYAEKNGYTPFQALLSLRILTNAEINNQIKKTFNIEKVVTTVNVLDFSVYRKVSAILMNEYRIVPAYKKDEMIYAYIDNPLNLIAGFLIQNQYSLPVVLQLIGKKQMDDFLKHISYADRRDRAITDLGKEEKVADVDKDDLNKYISAPAVALANTLLEEAVNQGASDIHIEPIGEEVRIRYRVDGVLIEHCRIALNLYQSLLARYKIMSELDIAERRIPQDGKITTVIDNKEYDFRISTLPNIYGEKIVIRLYNTLGDMMSVDKLASDKEDKRKISNLIRSPHGIVLLTGPTGSGKTTTLYAFLKELNKPGVNIQTVEDPVENQVDGVNQLQVNTKQGLTFASALRSILRQDPNIIMIGEIRDEETAHIAVQAAITGHLVFSTVHTNDAVTTVARLIDMGVEPYLVSDSLVGAISQRLVRKLCPDCKRKHLVNEHESRILGLKEGSVIYEAVGCPKCNHTGYKGRTAVFEILELSTNVKSAIDKKMFGNKELEEAARNDGLIPLRDRAIKLVKDGIISIEEFNALISHVGEE